MAQAQPPKARLCKPDAGLSRSRRPAAESCATALRRPAGEGSPLEAASPYHAFARCPATALFGRPEKWPGPPGSATTARLLWDDEALYVCWECEGRAAAAVAIESIDPSCLSRLKGGPAGTAHPSVLIDERVECFIWQPEGEAGDFPLDPKEADPRYRGQAYYAFEINYAGVALTSKASFGGPIAFDWDSSAAYTVWTQELSVGWGASSSPVPSGVPSLSPPSKRIVVAAFYWKAMGLDVGREVRIGLHRAQHAEELILAEGAQLDQDRADRILGSMVWSSWVDPGDAQVNFHRPSFFGRLQLASDGAAIDCSCCAARLFQSRDLRVLPSPMPSLAECPAGALLVRARYASLCGSDLPYFRDRDSKAPSCYWDRDGFCGHEVIGVVLESNSDKFAAGDFVMALPSSYFKAHAGSKQEWYREEVHSVLLEDFPVRGGFSQVYTSHELYSYKLKELVPRMLAAQGLGTVLRLARKIGSVLGKTVVVLGQGQNGLLATRLMAQFCAKEVIAVERIECRRKASIAFGATQAVSPEEAPSAIAAATDGRGADIVLEMVGHCQESINLALDYVASSGIVGAFGVPDDSVYHTFEYSKFFRKNVQLIASVIPDPGRDFPEAVQLVEQGRFSTEGIFTHTFPLDELQRAFTMAADYEDGVLKVVIDLGEP